jgi:dephospho-CoA kinase
MRKNSRKLTFEKPKGKFVIGLTGGVACGKTTVAKRFEKLGAKVISADVLAKEQLKPSKKGYNFIVSEFGNKILNPDKTINQQLLAKHIFSNTKLKKRLEKIVHPSVLTCAEDIANKTNKNIIVFEIPLLFETDTQNNFDMTINVYCSRPRRLARIKSRNWSKGELESREKNQLDPVKKCELADINIDNSTTLDSLNKRIDGIFKSIKTLK